MILTKDQVCYNRKYELKSEKKENNTYKKKKLLKKKTPFKPLGPTAS